MRPERANHVWSYASPAKILSGVKVFEISNIQGEETEVALSRRSECDNVTVRRKPLNGVLADRSCCCAPRSEEDMLMSPIYQPEMASRPTNL
jgi:hypothetical protein